MTNPSANTWTWYERSWHDGNPGLMGPRTHSMWMGSSVFDGARAFDGVTPDLRAHCERVNHSATRMGLRPCLSTDEIMQIARDGLRRFPPGRALYIRPMYWAEGDGIGLVSPDPDTTRFALTLFEAPLPEPVGFSMTVSAYRRPPPEAAPADVKSGALYPNSARALRDAHARGYANAVVLDSHGNVAETTTSNLFLVRDGVFVTPVANGCFLNGITRQRVIQLLRRDGRTVLEQRVTLDDLRDADELFSTGNYAKLQPCTRLDGQRYAVGPLFRKARELYWAYAHDRGAAQAA